MRRLQTRFNVIFNVAMSSSVEAVFTSVGCNRSPGSLRWLPSSSTDLVAFGASCLVAVMDPSKASIRCTLRGHDCHTTVNCVSWSTSTAGTHQLISGASDGSLIEWDIDLNSFEYEVSQRISGHSDSICCISSVIQRRSSEECLVATGSSDGTVAVWKKEESQSQWTLFQSMKGSAFGIRLPLSAALVEFRGLVFLAIGGVAHHITLFSLCQVSQKFVNVCTLKGHEDWIRSLDFCVDANGDALLASASQDSFIRLWRFSDVTNQTGIGACVMSSSTAGVFECSSLGNRGHLISGAGLSLQVSLESVLSGHDAWVYSVAWQPATLQRDGSTRQEMTLLSSSIDRSMIIWRYDEVADLWLSSTCVGEVGGHSLGCYGAVFSPQGDRFIGHTYNGSFYMWKRTDSAIVELCSTSGHNAAVSSLAWQPQGHYLLSCSEDKTTRLFAPCRWWDEGHGRKQQGYFEIARPQVHGYELNTICAIPSTPFKFATGAQEKVVRVFDAPQQFICDLASLSVAYKSSEGADYEERPVSAAVPELGLSNKAQGHVDTTLIKRLQPPGEAALIQDTLWPELSKLYGHGYEIFCVASSNCGSILASASASKEKLHSSIRLWDTQCYKQTQVLEVHGLTVVEMRFSASDRFLLSVSRDRSIAVCERGADGLYSVGWLLPKAHARIVWTCSWTHDERFFATGSRDKKVKVWRASGAQWELDSSFAMPSAVTCVRFLPALVGAHYVLAVALESGLIYIRTADSRLDKNLNWASITQVPDRMCPSGRVRDMEWKPLEPLVEGAAAPQSKFSLAVAGDDSSVRIFDINLPAI